MKKEGPSSWAVFSEINFVNKGRSTRPGLIKRPGLLDPLTAR